MQLLFTITLSEQHLNMRYMVMEMLKTTKTYINPSECFFTMRVNKNNMIMVMMRVAGWWCDMWGHPVAILRFVLRRMGCFVPCLPAHHRRRYSCGWGRKETGQTVQCLSKEEAAAGPQPTLTLSVYTMHS